MPKGKPDPIPPRSRPKASPSARPRHAAPGSPFNAQDPRHGGRGHQLSRLRPPGPDDPLEAHVKYLRAQCLHVLLRAQRKGHDSTVLLAASAALKSCQTLAALVAQGQAQMPARVSVRWIHDSPFPVYVRTRLLSGSAPYPPKDPPPIDVEYTE